jgi:hypothetical protein
MRSTLIIVALAVALVPAARAQTQIATFDSQPEAVIGTSYAEDGLLFGDIDSYLPGGTILPFVIENASGTLANKAGFGAPNLLHFNSATAGPSVSGFGRFGSITIDPGGVRRSAVVNLILLPAFGSNLITLEARLGGSVVASDAVPVHLFTPNWAPAVLSVAGVDFDELRLVSSGTADDGASFVGFDSIVVEAGIPGTTYCAALPNSASASGAHMTAQGTKSVHANNLVLKAVGVPNTQGLFFYGPSQAQTPFGDGFLCVSGPITRLAGLVGVNNELTHALNVAQPSSSAPPIPAGTTLNFQAWFRDPGFGAAGFNLSDALQVHFTP